MYTNRLIDSHDPYLLLHAHNPVDWYPWGPEALAKAKQENKPIFLSIGYSTCYWCHVAERTIYSDPEIAKLMNQWFVNIKVDREQRPDVDQIYMLATEILTRRGAWPNNLFLTPDLKPFFAGSYFPPRDDPAGGAGFPTILAALHDAWANHLQDKVLPVAGQVFQAMQRVQAEMTAGKEAPVKPGEWLRNASKALQSRIDPKSGGLGDRSGTKFPQAPSMKLLLTDYRVNHDKASLDAVTAALNAMAFGGIHDHLAGGFYRYSTEPTWSIPHFEKMLYDNAQLLRLYAEAYAATKDPVYRAVALDVGQYLRRDMMASEGGFYTAIDSEVKGVEGAAYVWTKAEIASVLGEQAAKQFLAAYDVTPMTAAGTQTGEPAADRKGLGVLRIRLPIEEALKSAGSQDAGQLLTSLSAARAQLLAHRQQRQQPARDEKILTDLAGLAIGALAYSSDILQQPEFLTSARMAAERIWALAYDPATRTLKHEIFAGHAQTDGYLQDYAMLGDGFISLYEVTKEDIWRDRAAMLVTALLRQFAHPDGALSTTLDEKNLLIPVGDSEDSDVPSGTSAALGLLLRLRDATGGSQFVAAAARIVHYLSGRLSDHPEIWPAAITVLNLHPLTDADLAAAREAAARSADDRGIGQAFRAPETSDHVRVSAVVRAGEKDDEIVVTLQIDDGYHVNANPASFDYLIPTSVAFAGLTSPGTKYPKPSRFKSAFAPEGLDVYEGTVPLVVTIPKGTIATQGELRGEVDVQACDAKICLPPSKLPLSVALQDK
ncbi:hypothetical protein AYJ54_06250 [Bradyrhizobium centrolobii]|uniref:Thioredoxin domain-containing protein n=1 Tax=Bradyrhizobium centrolobii TaxID=1505087 RepID=A0A176YXH4_9BRAD|nr:DUF255 domain-containing protein [Bradyrhizobium centrolobii]OAF12426.1 hypothetical protein AYJ54_06250 [Bradyrhizobium centrolobii]